MIKLLIFALLFNEVYANQTHNENKPCRDATCLLASLNSHYGGANFFMKLIPLNTRKGNRYHGKYFAQVDDADYDWLMQWKWCICKTKKTLYATRTDRTTGDYRSGGKHTRVVMHRQIVGVTDPSKLVDHIDHNGLNNQRNNLREATKMQNCKNRTSSDGSSSKFLGVCLFRSGGIKIPERIRWIAAIAIDGKSKHLGIFENEEDAARAYDDAAKIHHGQWANLNFKENDETWRSNGVRRDTTGN